MGQEFRKVSLSLLCVFSITSSFKQSWWNDKECLNEGCNLLERVFLFATMTDIFHMCINDIDNF